MAAAGTVEAYPNLHADKPITLRQLLSFNGVLHSFGVLSIYMCTNYICNKHIYKHDVYIVLFVPQNPEFIPSPFY